MPYKLIAHSSGGGEEFDHLYDQRLLTIGRDKKSDLVLLDTRHLVSRSHVEIRRKEDQFWLVDLASKNGTRLNKKKLSPRKEYQLREGDQIVIGSFHIDFIPIDLPGGDNMEVSALSLDRDDPVMQSQEIDDLISELNRAYCTQLDESEEHRSSCFQTILRRAIRGRSASETERLLRKIEHSFQSAIPRSTQKEAKRSSVFLEDEATIPKERVDADRKAYEGLLEIAGSYFKDIAFLKTPSEMEKFAKRIEKVLSVMVTSLASALKGRRYFEKEFDVNTTRILSWKLNPVKECGTGEEIGKYILDWRNEEKVGQAIADLEEGFNDLALHNLGLIAGFKECLRGILDQLNPDLIETEGKKGAGGLLTLEPMRSRTAWKIYREKYQKLRDEEVKTFETILGPYIAEGYLSIQKKKRI